MTYRLLGLLAAFAVSTAFGDGAVFNVRDHGAKGDGVALDSPAINAAIEAAAKQGGGTVLLPAGRYLSFSVRLQSHIELRLDPGATLVAATPGPDSGGYDEAEPNEWGDRKFQDYGHSHFHNSLVWGENLENVSITGPGRIDGRALLHGQARRGAPPGAGNKSIALKNCRNVTLRDFTILIGGWIGILATGVDNLTLDNLKIDTNRDGIDIDCCRNVRISNCSVNSPNDDAIVFKSSYALGELRACENITVNGCQVSGYDVGSFLDGTFKRTTAAAPDRDGPTGRIKFGTESNGGFKNIAISNCVFDRSRGLAIESVDGGIIEDIAVSNLTMRDVSNSPIFIRLGNRARGPEDTKVGTIRRVTISGITVSGYDARYPVLIAGLPDHPVEDVRISDVLMVSRGGLTMDQVAQQPPDLVNTFFLRGSGVTGPRDPFTPPEQEKAYPEPSMFGLLPAYGSYIRHAKNISFRDVGMSFEKDDTRPAIVLDDVAGATFDNLRAQRAADAPFFVLRKVTDFTIRACPGLPDTRRPTADDESL